MFFGREQSAMGKRLNALGELNPSNRTGVGTRGGRLSDGHLEKLRRGKVCRLRLRMGAVGGTGLTRMGREKLSLKRKKKKRSIREWSGMVPCVLGLQGVG